MKKRNFLMMLGLLGFGVTANAQTVIASLGFEEGEEQKYLNPDSVDKYPDWSADHINLGKEDVWNEDYTDDVHSGTYALQVKNVGTAWSGSVTGNAWDRGLKLRNLQIKPETSYRVSFWVKANSDYQAADGSTAGKTEIKSSLSIGIENLEAPWVSQNGTQYYYRWQDEENGVMSGEWQRFSFVAYYSGSDVQNKVFDDFNNNIKDVTESGDTIYWGEEYDAFPETFFLTINMYNPTQYLLDDIKIEEGVTVAGCTHTYSAIRVDFGYPTNLDDLAKASTEPAGRYIIPNEWVKVIGDGQELTPLSVEGWEDGYMYIFFDEMSDDAVYLDGLENITVSFNPPADCAIKYDTDQRPSMDVESEMTVLPFENEVSAYDADGSYWGAESYVYSDPTFVSSVPESHSFELDPATFTQVKLTYDMAVQVNEARAYIYDGTYQPGDSQDPKAVGTLSVDPNDPMTVIASFEPLANGEYTLSVYGVGNALVVNGSYNENTIKFSVGPDETSGVREVLYTSSDFATTAGGAFPKGWAAREGESLQEYPNTYGSGPRMFADLSGDFDGGLYWRGNECTLTFGDQIAYYLDGDGNPLESIDKGCVLYLTPRNYQLSFTMAAWKGEPPFTYTVEKINNLQVPHDGTATVVAESDEAIVAAPNLNGNGTAVVTNPVSVTKEFSVTEEGYYMVVFHGDVGYPEYMLGSMEIVSRPSDAAYYKSILKVAADSAQAVLTDSVADVKYDGTTKTALQNTLEEAQGTVNTPTQVDTLSAKLYALCGEMLARKTAVDKYDAVKENLRLQLGKLDGTEAVTGGAYNNTYPKAYTMTDAYVEGHKVYDNYVEVLAQDLEDEELLACVADMEYYGSLASNTWRGVNALTYRFTQGAETAKKLGVEPQSLIDEVETAIADDNELANTLNHAIKLKMYEILAAEGDLDKEMIANDTIFNEEGDKETSEALVSGLELSSFVVNPNFYSYAANTDTIMPDNTPGWTTVEGFVPVSSLVSDVNPVVDNRLHPYRNEYKVEQSITGLPVGIYKVFMRTRTALQTAADGSTFEMNGVSEEGVPDKFIWAVTSDAPSDTIRAPFKAGGIQYPFYNERTIYSWGDNWGGYPTVIEQEITVNENTVLTVGVKEKYVSGKNLWVRNSDGAWEYNEANEDQGNWDTQCYADNVRLVFVAPLEGYDYAKAYETGIDEVKAAEVVSCEYYTVGGIKLERPAKGLNIVKTYYADGTVKVQTKIMK